MSDWHELVFLAPIKPYRVVISFLIMRIVYKQKADFPFKLVCSKR